MRPEIEARLREAFRRNPPGDLTDPRVVREMCRQNDEAMKDTIERLERMHSNSLAQMFTKVIG